MQQPGLCIAAARVGCVFAAGLCSCWSCRWQNDNDTLAASCKMASLIVLKNWWLIWNILNLCLEIKRPRHLQNLQDMKDGKVPWWAMPPDVLQLYLAPLMRWALPFHGASTWSPIPCRKSKRPIASSCGNGIQIRIQTKLPGCVWQNAGALLKSFLPTTCDQGQDGDWSVSIPAKGFRTLQVLATSC